MTKTHEAVIIHDDTKDIMKHMKIACSQVKAKLNIADFVIPVDWIPRPYGYIVVVEVPENSGASRGGKASEVGSGKAKD